MALINLRNAMMGGRRLPYDAEVEFLESSGTQWIDTGVASFDWPYLEITCKVNGTYTNQYSRGIIGNSNGASRWQGISPYGTGGVSFRGSGDGTLISESVTSDFITLIFDGPNRMAYAGQSSATLLSGAATSGATYGVWAYVGRVYPMAMSVASVKIGTSSDNLLFDGIPVRKGTVGYLYDRVSGQLFGNAGTGDFVLGPDVVPVEYIESHGTEWIDTGVTYNYENDIDIQANAARLTNNRAVIVGNFYGDTLSAISLEFGGVANALTGRPRGYFRLGIERYGVSLNLNSVPANTFIPLGGHVTASTRYAEVASAADSASETLSSDAVINNGYTLKLFKDNRANTSAIAYGIKLATVQISQSDAQIRNFRPVRVGTDATSWEGAMMDVLTRRIYRNAGTGAFTYGNDLKYPIPAS